MTTTERIRFEGAQGGRLAARLELPEGRPTAFALFAHCFTCSKNYKAVVQIGRDLAERGIAVLRFDFTGLGESEGDFSNTNFSSNIGDLEAAAAYLRREFEAPSLLIGHSLGGAAMLAVAPRIPESRAVVTIGAPSDTEHLSDKIVQMAPDLRERGEARVTIAGRAFTVRQQLLEDLEEHRMQHYASELDRPLLIIHSPDDETVAIDHAMRLFGAARFPKSFLSIDGANHLLTNRPDDQSFVARAIADWAGRYIQSAGTPEPAEDLGEPGEVVVSGGADRYATEIRAGRHVLTADEPIKAGGGDRGTNPYSLLLAALGACQVVTLRMYADRKGWPLESSKVRLRHTRIHARDCEECETEEGRIDRLDVELELEGRLSEQQRHRLVEVSGRCPVHRSLERGVRIRTSAV